MDHEGFLLDLPWLALMILNILALDGDRSIAMLMETISQFHSSSVVLCGGKISTMCGDESHHVSTLKMSV